MRFLLLIAGLLACAASPLAAQAETRSERAARARTIFTEQFLSWRRCVNEVSDRLQRSTEVAEVVAQVAITSCEALEAPLENGFAALIALEMTEIPLEDAERISTSGKSQAWAGLRDRVKAQAVARIVKARVAEVR